MVLTIVKKELKRVFSDKRLIFSTFILPALSIYIIYSLMGSMAGNLVEDIQANRGTIYVTGAPESFVDFMSATKDNYNADISLGSYQYETVVEQLRSKEVDLFVEFPSTFDETVANYESISVLPDINAYYNPAEEYSGAAQSLFVYNILSDYESYLLQERFGNLNYAEAFEVKNMSVVEDSVVATSFITMILPMLIGIMLFAGAMSIGLDTIAGEKERGTMATLLLTPVKREHIALGKVIGLVIISILTSLAYFVAILLSLPKLAAMNGGGASGSFNMAALGFSAFNMVELVVLMITLVGIYVGLIAFISVRARTMKEAGTYMAPVYMIVMMAAFGTMFSQGSAAMYQFFIPIYGTLIAFTRLFSNELTTMEFAAAAGTSVVVTGILVFLITRAFNSEKVMFSA